MSEGSSITIQRRHDLDALRAFAMLLGIALHAGLSFTVFPWVAQDSRQNELFGLFFLTVHGFRMPLFFLVSGFFAAMLWRRRGPMALLKQRTKRIFLPCMLGLVTIVPAMDLVSSWAMKSAPSRPVVTDDGSLVSAIRLGDHAGVVQRLDAGAKINVPDSSAGVMPLTWAALLGDRESARILLDRGADVNGKNRDGSSPLHSAAFLGRAEVAQLLLDRGADANARTPAGDRPLNSAKADWDLVQFVARLLRIPLVDKAEVEQGRERIIALLKASADSSDDDALDSRNEKTLSSRSVRLLDAYQGLISSNALKLSYGDESFHLILTPVFHHLWFLWFLCWLVPLFMLAAWLTGRLGWSTPPPWLILSPARLLWLLPLTLLPQWFMGIAGPSFGPDTSSGILPLPHVLLYYGIFFGFGALYFDADDTEGRLGRWWWLTLPLALFVALPVGVISLGYRPITAVVQVIYAWAMTFGLMGLCRKILRRENRTIRYISDSSYWLYLTHLPLIIAAQAVVIDWPLPAFAKFTLICTSVVGLLLVVYQTCVRYTWLGTLLNGPRTRPTIPPS